MHCEINEYHKRLIHALATGLNTAVLTTEVELWAGAEGVDDVNNQTVCRSPEGQWPSGYKQGHYVEQVR